jgi:enoyl-CoA hydratase
MPRAAIEICRLRLAPAHFQRAVMLAETYTPSDGVAAGFLDRVVPEADLIQEATLLAEQFATLDSHAHATTKALARAASIDAVRTGLAADREIFRQLG